MGDHEFYYDDDLEQIAQESMRMGVGQQGRQLDPWTSPFARLAKGKTLGKRTVVNVEVTGGFPVPSVINSPVVDMLEVRGEDEDAMQLGLTLNPPLLLPTTGLTLPANPDDINGQMSNQQILATPPVGFFYGRPQASVEWGIGGLSNRIDVDFQNGAVMNLQASWLRVRGTVLDFPTRAAYALGVFVGPSHAAPSRCQFTQFMGQIDVAPAATAIFAIPRFAKEVQIATTAVLATTDFVLDFLRSPTGGAVVSTIRYLAAAGSSPYYPPINSKTLIPGDAYFYRITNGSPTVLSFRAIFDLAI